MVDPDVGLVVGHDRPCGPVRFGLSVGIAVSRIKLKGAETQRGGGAGEQGRRGDTPLLTIWRSVKVI